MRLEAISDFKLSIGFREAICPMQRSANTRFEGDLYGVAAEVDGGVLAATGTKQFGGA